MNEGDGKQMNNCSGCWIVAVEKLCGVSITVYLKNKDWGEYSAIWTKFKEEHILAVR